MFSRRFLRIKVVKALYAYYKSVDASVSSAGKNLDASIDKAYDLYFQMLELVVDVRRYAAERIEIGRNKRLPSHEELNPNTRFVDNAAIAMFETDEELNRHLDRHSLGWSRHPELIKELYDRMTESEYYKKYMLAPGVSFAADVEFVKDFYIETVQDNPVMEEVVEEQSILWSDDVDFTLGMVVRTLENFRPNQRKLPLRVKFKNDDDAAFARELFLKTVANHDDFQRYIERFTQNWDVERIAYIDNILLAMSMTELVCFESIPVKVTLDEYIEIAKYYSTPGSSLFINGVLDKIVGSLTEEGRIRKTGRGLMS